MSPRKYIGIIWSTLSYGKSKPDEAGVKPSISLARRHSPVNARVAEEGRLYHSWKKALTCVNQHWMSYCWMDNVLYEVHILAEIEGAVLPPESVTMQQISIFKSHT